MSSGAQPKLLPLQFTHVVYEAGDFLGYLLAWSSLVPIFTFVAQITAFLLAETDIRRRQTGTLIIGQLATELLNAVLKRLLRHPRPIYGSWNVANFFSN